MEQAVIDAEIAIRERGGVPYTNRIRLERTRLENALNLYFVKVMNAGVNTRMPDSVTYGIQALVLDTKVREDIMTEVAFDLATLLAAEPVYATSQDPIQQDTEALATLRKRLTGFNVFECYCKVERNKQMTEQFVKMEPLPWVVQTSELAAKRERIRQNMIDQGIITRRKPLAGEHDEPPAETTETKRASNRPTLPAKAELDED